VVLFALHAVARVYKLWRAVGTPGVRALRSSVVRKVDPVRRAPIWACCACRWASVHWPSEIDPTATNRFYGRTQRAMPQSGGVRRREYCRSIGRSSGSSQRTATAVVRRTLILRRVQSAVQYCVPVTVVPAARARCCDGACHAVSCRRHSQKYLQSA